mgnify:CR=1 FL=1
MDAFLLHQSDVEELVTIDRLAAVARRVASLATYVCGCILSCDGMHV